MSRTRPFKALGLRLWTLALSICLMLMPVSQARSGTADTEAITIAHPQQAGAGQPFLVRLTSSKAFDRISVRWMGQEVSPSVSRWNKHHVAIAMLGTDVLTIKPGPQPLIIHARAGGQETVWHQPVKITPQSYPRQRLSLPPKMVTPPGTERERIQAERIRTQNAKNTWSPQRVWRLPLHRPVGGEITSIYGLRRILNGTPKNPHRGMDFRAPTGTAVEAVADGRVILAESHYYAGNAIYIDHGNGVVSLYFHLDRFDVFSGDRVKRGQTIGRAGSTGRATGPHLHLSVSVQGQLVDPAPLFEATTDQLLR